jgi:hypothetical protein
MKHAASNILYSARLVGLYWLDCWCVSILIHSHRLKSNSPCRVFESLDRPDQTRLDLVGVYTPLQSTGHDFLHQFLLLLLLLVYSPGWTLASSKIIPHSSRSCDSRLQFLTPKFLRASSIDSRHLHLGFPTCQVPCGLCRVSFLQGSSSGRVLSFYLGNI